MTDISDNILMEEFDKIDARKNVDILELSLEALEEFDEEEEEWFLSPAVVNISKPQPSKKSKTNHTIHNKTTNCTKPPIKTQHNFPKHINKHQKITPKILITAQCTMHNIFTHINIKISLQNYQYINTRHTMNLLFISPNTIAHTPHITPTTTI